MVTNTDGGGTSSNRRDSRTPTEVSGWAGWITFGGVILILSGIFQIMQGLVALFDDGFYAVRPNGLVINVNYNTWGWTYLILGILGALVGMGLFAGNMVARVFGVIIASLSAIANLGFLTAAPVWSTLVIALDVIVIYAIVVHGRELKSDSNY